MRKYELSISSNYVASWGKVEAIRELFQNAIDEQTRDATNTMSFEYDDEACTLRIGNANSTLDIQSLLLGSTDKADNDAMIGQHGEGYKVATVVLLRNKCNVTVYNYNEREVWTTRLVKSRRYNGALVPTFFVDKLAFWETAPESTLVIEVSNITAEDMETLKAKNLHLRDAYPDNHKSSLGAVLLDASEAGNVYLAGLFVCHSDEIKYGYDFIKGSFKLDRDRSLVSSFDLTWNASKLLAALADKDFLKSILSYADARHVHLFWSDSASLSYTYRARDTELGRELAETTLEQYGSDAVPVSSQAQFDEAKEQNLKPVMMSEAKCEIIKASSTYTTVESARAPKVSLYDQLRDFFIDIADCLSDAQSDTAANLLVKIEEELG